MWSFFGMVCMISVNIYFTKIRIINLFWGRSGSLLSFCSSPQIWNFSFHPYLLIVDKNCINQSFWLQHDIIKLSFLTFLKSKNMIHGHLYLQYRLRIIIGEDFILFDKSENSLLCKQIHFHFLWSWMRWLMTSIRMALLAHLITQLTTKIFFCNLFQFHGTI